jgi:hypothetical protein
MSMVVGIGKNTDGFFLEKGYSVEVKLGGYANDGRTIEKVRYTCSISAPFAIYIYAGYQAQ